MYILEVERLATPSMEDYIEQIYLQLEARGEARVSDVAEAFSVLAFIRNENGSAARS